MGWKWFPAVSQSPKIVKIIMVPLEFLWCMWPMKTKVTKLQSHFTFNKEAWNVVFETKYWMILNGTEWVICMISSLPIKLHGQTFFTGYRCPISQI